MNQRIINHLKAFYIQHRERIHVILTDMKMRDVCDAYYRDELNMREICDALNMSIHEVNGRLLAAASIMIRCKGDLE